MRVDVKSRLQEMMTERGWTIYRIAKEAGIPWSTVRNMFKRNTEPSITTLEAICNGMGITLAQFFDFDHSSSMTDEQRLLIGQWNCLEQHDKKIISYLIQSLAQKDGLSDHIEQK